MKKEELDKMTEEERARWMAEKGINIVGEVFQIQDCHRNASHFF